MAFMEALQGASEYHKRRSVIHIMIMNQGDLNCASFVAELD